MLIHQLEMLEIQEEIDNEDDDEDLEILEEEEANVTPELQVQATNNFLFCKEK